MSHPFGNLQRMFKDADHRLAEVAATQYAVFSRADARAAGLKHGQMDRRAALVWTPVHRGIYRAAGAPETWKSALLAACRAASRPAAISHRAAAALYELPGALPDSIELTCARWRRPRHPGIVVHESTRIQARDIHEIDGIPVFRPELVVLELAGWKPLVSYVEAVVQAARRKRLITYQSTREMFERHARRGVRGVQVMRSVLESWDPDSQPTESEMETLLLQVLSIGGFVRPVPQHVILDNDGSFVARVDVALPDLRIAIEYDSMQEHSDEFQLTRDARRRNRILAAGWRCFSARYRDLESGGVELLESISAACRSI